MPKQSPLIRPENQNYLVLNNIAKDANFGFLIRTANAFGAVPVVVGRRRYSRGGAVGGTSRTPVLNFFCLDEAVADLKSRGCDICGVEITDDAKPIQGRAFRGPTAFLIGNEGEGLNRSQKAACDWFTYIPQYGNAVSLNINAATAIVLHHFADWAGFEERCRSGGKFVGPADPGTKL